eukprot:403332352
MSQLGNSLKISQQQQDAVMIEETQIDLEFIRRIDPFDEIKDLIYQMEVQANLVKSYTKQMQYDIQESKQQQTSRNDIKLKLYMVQYNKKRERYEVKWLKDSNIKLKINNEWIPIKQEGLPVDFKISKSDMFHQSQIDLDIQISVHTALANHSKIYHLVICQVQDTDLSQKLSPNKLNQVTLADDYQEEIFNLQDSNSLKKIEIPVKGKNCQHLQCFDYESFLNINMSQYMTWLCPICRKITYCIDLLLCLSLKQFISQNTQVTKYDKIKMKGNIVKLYDPKLDNIEPVIKRRKVEDSLTKYSNEIQIQAKQIHSDSLKDQMIGIIQEVKKDKTYLKQLEINNQNQLTQIFQLLQDYSVEEYSSLINEIFDQILDILPIDLPAKTDESQKLKSNERFMNDSKLLYKHFKLLFIPFIFWAKVTERNLIKALSSLKFISKFQKINPNPLLQASAYFIYKFLHRKNVIFEFVYGKIFGYQIKQAKQTEQSLKFSQFIEVSIQTYNHLHLPEVTFESKAHQSFYYKTMTSFYIGIFSWFPIMFIAHSFKQVFSPPKPQNTIATLEEKACLNLFVKQVIMRIIKGLRLSINEVTQFYEIWDPHGAIMKMNKGYKFGEVGEQVTKFKQMLRMKRYKEMIKDKQILMQN